MGNMKSAKSHHLPYAKPKSGEEPVMPKLPERIDPVAYIRCWDKYNHREPVDISKAKPMTKDDLKKADPRAIELMLAYGVTQKQLSQQYNTPYGSITTVLRNLGVNTKVELIIPPIKTAEIGPAVTDAPVTPATSPEQAEPELPPMPENEFIWFAERSITDSSVIVRDSGRISLSAEVSKSLVNDYIKIGVSRDGSKLKIAPVFEMVTNNNLKLTTNKDNRKSINLKALAVELSWLKIEFPAKYVGAWQGGEWTGTLQ